MRILIAEDSPRMASLLQRAVQRDGYATLVAHDGDAAWEAIERNHFDGIVMDVMMPKLSGFEVLQRMRSEDRSVPTILLTARDSTRDVVHGLDLGADDYLTKPFELSVLMARLRAVTRRPLTVLPAPHLCVGGLTLRPASHDLLCQTRTVPLTRLQYTLLEVLMQRPGQVVPKETLFQIGWGVEEEYNESTLYVLISSLRAKLQSVQAQSLLLTVRGVGYMLRVTTAE